MSLEKISENADIIDTGKRYAVIDYHCNSIRFFGLSTEFVREKDSISELDFNSRINCNLCTKENDKLYVTIVTNFKCNMFCVYCYEQDVREKGVSSKQLSEERIISFISELSKAKNTNIIYLSFVGGEPLLDENIEYIDRIITSLRNRGLSLVISIVSNGLTVKKYIKEIRSWKISDIQITLDGMEKVQNLRRKPYSTTLNGFVEISQGIECLLEDGINVNLRINVDGNNVQDLPHLLRYIIEKKWNTYSSFFPYYYPITASGNKNYQITLSEVDVFERLLSVLRDCSEEEQKLCVLNFHGIDYLTSIMSNQIPELRRNFCGYSRGQIVVNNDGDLYSCWWGIGSSLFKIGNIDDNPPIDGDKMIINSMRNVTEIERCKECKYRFLCGAGCAYREWQNTGGIQNGNCAEFHKLFSLYFRYLEDEQWLLIN